MLFWRCLIFINLLILRIPTTLYAGTLVYSRKHIKNSMFGLSPLLKERTEICIQRGLQYLFAEQKTDGSWDNHPGITALAASAFLRSPIRNADVKWKTSVDKALDYIDDLSKPDGGIYTDDLPSLNTAVCILALSQSNNSKFKSIIEKAQHFLVRLQCDESAGYTRDDNLYGGIRYGSDRTPDLDNLDYTLQALKSSGFSVNHNIWERAVCFIQRCQNRKMSNDQSWSANDGGFIYYPKYSMAGYTRSYGSMTSAGISCFYHANVKKDDPRVVDAFRWINEHYTLEENPHVEKKGLFHYYYTLAKALDSYGELIIKDSLGTEYNWKEELAYKLTELQNNEGFWVNECQEWWEGNRTLVTSYAILTLAYLY